MEYTVNNAKETLLKITRILIGMKDDLTKIDSRLGDGDMGISMEKGSLAIRKTVEEMEADVDLKTFFLNCAASLNRAAPSTMGTLLCMGLMQAGKMFEGQTTLCEDDLVKIPKAMAEAIACRGRAKVGDKTILDALVPFSDTLIKEHDKGLSLSEAWRLAVEDSRKGMESTKGMIANTGRAKWLGERNSEYPDGGAYMCYHMVKELDEEV